MKTNCARWAVLFVAVFALAHCRSNQTHPTALLQVDGTLAQTNDVLRSSSTAILESMKQRLYDPRTKEKAERWLPLARKADSSAVAVLKLLEKYQTQLATAEIGNEQFFQDQDRGLRLFQQLRAFKTDFVAVDSATLPGNKPGWLSAIDASTDSAENERLFLQQLYSLLQAEAQLYLRSLQTEVLGAELEHLQYCHYATTPRGDHYDAFEAIVGQNAKILRAGDVLEITAGLGRFEKTQQPIITIGSENMQLNEHNLAVRKIVTPQKAGNYSLPVKVAFVDQEGKLQERTFTVDYTLVDRKP